MIRALAIFLLLYIRAFGVTYWFDSAPFTTYGEFNPTPVFSTTDSGHTVKELQPSQSIRFASSTAAIGIYTFTSTAAGRTYVTLQDGVQVGSYAFPASGGGSFAVYTIASGLDTSRVHEYEIICVTPLSGSASSWYDGYLELDNLASIAHPNRVVWGMYGDSITAVTNASPAITDTRQDDMWIFTHATGTAMYIVGTAGGKVVNTGRDSTHNIPQNVGAVRNEYGTNDLPDLGSSGPNATFQQAYSDMIDNERSWIGAGKPIICLQPFPRSAPNDVNRALCGTLIQAAIAGKTLVTYANTDNWWDPNNGALTADGLHPNAAGYVFLANREIPIWSSASITAYGPANASSGGASGAFTVTLANTATFTGDQPILLTVGAGTMSATASGGSISNNGTAAVTVSPVNGAASFTFTYTAGSGGTFRIVPTTTQQLWTMPAAPYININANAPGSPRTSAFGF